MAVLNAMKVRFETLRTISFGAISGTYTRVGAVFSQPVRQIKFQSTMDADLVVSFNGVDDQDFVVQNSGFIYDYASNKAEKAGVLEQSAGEGVYVKQDSGAPTAGQLTITVIYAASN